MIQLTIDDVRLAFIQIVHGAAFGHTALRSPAVQITNSRVFTGLMIIVQESLIQGVYKGLLTYRMNSHKPLDNEKMLGSIGSVLDGITNEMLLAYAEKISDLAIDLTPEQQAKSAATAMNKATTYVFNKLEVDIQIALNKANDILKEWVD